MEDREGECWSVPTHKMTQSGPPNSNIHSRHAPQGGMPSPSDTIAMQVNFFEPDASIATIAATSACTSPA